jgi:hypothetical protein
MPVPQVRTGMSRTVQILIGVAAVVAAGFLVFSHLPTAGYDSDIGRVGQGRPAVVLVFENFAPPSVEAMQAFDRVRGDYADRLEFLVADTGTPWGRDFIDRHGAHVGQVLTFRGDGTRVRVGALTGGERELRERLRQDLGL